MNVDMRSVVPILEMKGQDREETNLLRGAFEEASSFIHQFRWCRGVKEAYFGLGVGGVVAVFLYRIDPIGENDEWLWVVTGDLPPAYLVTDEASTPLAALNVYCGLMDDWVQAVRGGKSLDDVYPVSAPPTTENADMLAKRVSLLREEIIPAFA